MANLFLKPEARMPAGILSDANACRLPLTHVGFGFVGLLRSEYKSTPFILNHNNKNIQ
jgi:hypothetical protein